MRQAGGMAERKKKRGGGPKTPEGKAAVRRNPIKHGVLAQTPVIPLVEREEDWRRLRDGVFEYFRVEGAMGRGAGGPHRWDYLAVVPRRAVRVGVDQQISA